MNPKHMRVWPLGDYPAESIDLADESGEIVLRISATGPDERAEPCTLIDDDGVHILADEERITKNVVRRELRKLSESMAIKWVYVHSDEKLLEMLEEISRDRRSTSA